VGKAEIPGVVDIMSCISSVWSLLDTDWPPFRVVVDFPGPEVLVVSVDWSMVERQVRIVGVFS